MNRNIVSAAFSPPSGRALRRFQNPPARGRFLAVLGMGLARLEGQTPEIETTYLSTIDGNRYLTTEIRSPTPDAIRYGVSPDLTLWKEPGVDGAPNVIAAVSPTDGQLTIARLDAPVTAGSRYFLRAYVPSKRAVDLDFDGDGISDWAVIDLTQPTVVEAKWKISLSGGGIREVIFGNVRTDYPVPVDFDGDGKTDIAMYQTTPSETAQPGLFKILQSSTGTVREIVLGNGSDSVIVAGDYDGDGKADPAVFRRPASAGLCRFLYIGSLNNPDNVVTEVLWGMRSGSSLVSILPCPGDYDGDGRYDFCVAVPDTGGRWKFELKRSSDGGTETIRHNFIFNTDYLISGGDYDGDGKTDFAIARTGTSGSVPMEWQIFERDGGGTGGVPITWGKSSDPPTPADYDGDGRYDIAVRVSNVPTFSARLSASGDPLTFDFGDSRDFVIAKWRNQ